MRSTLSERSASVSAAPWGLESSFSTVVIANPDGFGNFVDEDFAVADFAGACGAGDGARHFVEALVRHHQFHLHLRQQIDVVFLAAVSLLMALLPAMAANLGDCHAINANGLQGFLDLFELERLDNR